MYLAAFEQDQLHAMAFDLDARDGVDQTPSFDPAEPAPIPDLDMDQTRAG